LSLKQIAKSQAHRPIVISAARGNVFERQFQTETLPTTAVVFRISIAANSMAEAEDEDA
jgi:hypothetical protein